MYINQPNYRPNEQTELMLVISENKLNEELKLNKTFERSNFANF